MLPWYTLIHERLIKTRPFLLIILFLLPGIIASFIINFIFYATVSNHAAHKGGPDFENGSIMGMVLLVLVIAPVIETLFFQYLLIEGLGSFFKRRKWPLVIISAGCFAVVHSYSIYYVVESFFSGLMLAYAYLVFNQKKVSAFGYVSLLHSLRNMIPFLIFLCR